MAAAPAPATPCLTTAAHMAPAQRPRLVPAPLALALPSASVTRHQRHRHQRRQSASTAGGGDSLHPYPTRQPHRHGARPAPQARAPVAHVRASASVARRHRLDARLLAVDLPEQNDRRSAVGRGRAPKKGRDERAGERPIAHATPVLEVGSGARAFGSGCGRAGSDMKRPHRPTPGTGSVSKGGGVSPRGAHRRQNEAAECAVRVRVANP